MAYYNLYELDSIREFYKYACLYGTRSPKMEKRLEHDLNIFYDSFKEAQIYRVVIPMKLNLINIDLPSILNLP